MGPAPNGAAGLGAAQEEWGQEQGHVPAWPVGKSVAPGRPRVATSAMAVMTVMKAATKALISAAADQAMDAPDKAVLECPHRGKGTNFAPKLCDWFKITVHWDLLILIRYLKSSDLLLFPLQMSLQLRNWLCLWKIRLESKHWHLGLLALLLKLL